MLMKIITLLVIAVLAFVTAPAVLAADLQVDALPGAYDIHAKVDPDAGTAVVGCQITRDDDGLLFLEFVTDGIGGKKTYGKCQLYLVSEVVDEVIDGTATPYVSAFATLETDTAKRYLTITQIRIPHKGLSLRIQTTTVFTDDSGRRNSSTTDTFIPKPDASQPDDTTASPPENAEF